MVSFHKNLNHLYDHYNHHHETDSQIHRKHIDVIFDHMLNQKLRHYTSLKLFWDNIIYLDPHKTYQQDITLIQHNLQLLLENKTDHGTFWPIMSPGPVTVTYSIYSAIIFGFFLLSFTFSAFFHNFHGVTEWFTSLTRCNKKIHWQKR